MSLPAWAQVSPERRAHIERVVSLLSSWADAMHVDPKERDRWVRAGWLHDALRDAAGDKADVTGKFEEMLARATTTVALPLLSVRRLAFQ